METISITLDNQQIKKLYDSYPNKKICKTPPYATYQFKLSDCTITAYTSGKVVFQGDGASIHAPSSSTAKKNSVNKRSTTIVHYPHIGSDEVGTGDYFGPVCVCAAYVKEEDIPFLRDLQIQDSKMTTDVAILKVAPKLMEHLTYSLLILPNEKYNAIHPTNNMNQIKAKLHNQAYEHLIQKIGQQPNYIYLDQFTPEPLYFRYLKGESNIIKGIHFETKAENKFLGVACGSIIARYAFLKAMEDMNQRYDFNFPKGAGKHVDEAIQKFVNQFSFEELNFVAKTHFVNTSKAIKIE